MFCARFKTEIYSDYGDQADVDVPGGKGNEGADTVKMLQEALTKSLASGFGTLERKTCELSGVLRRSGASLWSRYRGI